MKIKIDQTKVARGHMGKRGTVAFGHKCNKRMKTRNNRNRAAIRED
jgi:hypothetical protein